jgi:hypothetical protein
MDDAIKQPQSMSRTSLLKLGAFAALAFGAGPAAKAAAGALGPAANDEGSVTPAGPAPGYLRLATYVPLVGSAFRISREGSSPLKVKLVSAQAQALAGKGESFSLIFRGSRHAELPQQISTLEHPLLGRFDLFVAPVGRGVKGQEFQAVVNRIAHAGGNLG